jgi:hypothetical protein
LAEPEEVCRRRCVPLGLLLEVLRVDVIYGPGFVLPGQIISLVVFDELENGDVPGGEVVTELGRDFGPVLPRGMGAFVVGG